MTADPDDPRPIMLVIGHLGGPATVRDEAGTLTGWARDRGVRLHPVAVGAPADPGAPGASGLPGAHEVDAIAVLGSAEGAWDDGVPWLADELALLADADRRGTPVLGICFGGQLLARALGGRVEAGRGGEHGWTTIETREPAAVEEGPWLQFHGDSFVSPPASEVLARSAACDQVFRAGPHLGVQFHPEITPAEFELWARSWRGTALEESFPALGITTDGVRREIARHAGRSRAASRRLFDAFAEQAGLAPRMLV